MAEHDNDCACLACGEHADDCDCGGCAGQADDYERLACGGHTGGHTHDCECCVSVEEHSADCECGACANRGAKDAADWDCGSFEGRGLSENTNIEMAKAGDNGDGAKASDNGDGDDDDDLGWGEIANQEECDDICVAITMQELESEEQRHADEDAAFETDSSTPGWGKMDGCFGQSKK